MSSDDEMNIDEGMYFVSQCQRWSSQLILFQSLVVVSLGGEAGGSKIAQVIIVHTTVPSICTNFTLIGGNDHTVAAEPTYDRVESSHVKDDTRAARCKCLMFT